MGSKQYWMPLIRLQKRLRVPTETQKLPASWVQSSSATLKMKLLTSGQRHKDRQKKRWSKLYGKLKEKQQKKLRMPKMQQKLLRLKERQKKRQSKQEGTQKEKL